METYKKQLFEISIPRYQNTKRYTEYQIVIVAQIPKFGNDCYFVYRRYSDFERLHKILEKEIMYLPPFPSKVFWNKKRAVMEDRKTKLDIYLKYIASFIIRNGYENCESGKEFLKFISHSNTAYK